MIRGKLRNEPRIFISYRHDDSGGYVGRLYNDLIKQFSKKNIFMDIDAIEFGDEFTRAIETTVNSCDVLLAVIGRDWLTIQDKENGVRRLDHSDDFVRYEIAIALKRNIVVIPVLVQGATMPRSAELPDELKSLAVRQAIEFSDTRWDYDLKKLVGRLKRVNASEGTQIKPWQKIGLAIAGVAILSVGIWWSTGIRLTGAPTPTPAPTPVVVESALSGTYKGIIDYPRRGLSGTATLTITGRQFTLTSGAQTFSGSIVTDTALGYTAATMRFTSDGQPEFVSLSVHRNRGDLTLKSVPGEPNTFSFTTR